MRWQRQHIGKQFQIAYVWVCVSWENCDTFSIFFTITTHPKLRRTLPKTNFCIKHTWATAATPSKALKCFSRWIFQSFAGVPGLDTVWYPWTKTRHSVSVTRVRDSGMPIHLASTSGSCKYAQVRCREFNTINNMKWATDRPDWRVTERTVGTLR